MSGSACPGDSRDSAAAGLDSGSTELGASDHPHRRRFRRPGRCLADVDGVRGRRGVDADSAGGATRAARQVGQLGTVNGWQLPGTIQRDHIAGCRANGYTYD